MPVNRNALIRYKTIDKCLQNRYREWTLEDLIEACSEALYEYEGIAKGISKRTVQLDIQMMRSDKLGYNAPIIVYDNKYYTYEDREYSITNIPLTDKDLGKLSEAVEFMKQFKGFSHFKELDGMIQKLEDHVYSQKKKQKPAIDFEKNENLKGLEFLDILYQSIIQQRAIQLSYQSFRARQASTFLFHPYLLKEFRNRWFILGVRQKNEPILTLALDRILEVRPSEMPYVAGDDFDAEEYFRDVIGVTVSENQEPEKVVLYVSHKHANYVITKPLHRSQRVTGRDNFGITIELHVQLNFELEKEILGMGEGIMVVAPERLKREITGRLNDAIDLYQTAIHEKSLVTIRNKLENRGFAVVNHLYTKSALIKAGSILHRDGILEEHGNIVKIIDPQVTPKLASLLINRNIENIIRQFPENMALREIVFHRFIPDDCFMWKQSEEEMHFSLIFFLEHPRISSFPVYIIPGSHKKRFNAGEQELIAEHGNPAEILLAAGGAVLTKPLLLRKFSDDLREKKVMYFEMRFS